MLNSVLVQFIDVNSIAEKKVFHSLEVPPSDAAGILEIVKNTEYIRLHQDELTTYKYEWAYFVPAKDPGGFINMLEIYVSARGV